MNKRIVSFFFLLLFAGSLYAAIGITDLRTEQLKNPAGIDVRQPRLSWRIESDEQNVIQTAYHILVASSPELLEQGKGDIWDSGKIESDASQWITHFNSILIIKRISMIDSFKKNVSIILLPAKTGYLSSIE